MKLAIAILFTFFSISLYSQSISGTVYDKSTKVPLPNTMVYLLIRDFSKDTSMIYYDGLNEKYKIIKETISNKTGNYLFQSLDTSTYSIAVKFKMPTHEVYGSWAREDLDSNIRITNKTIYKKDFHLLVTCPYDKTKNLKVCPICKKADKILKIWYGLPVYDENGDIGNYQLARCFRDFVCNPTQHCKRCAVDF